jgi:RNA polymerase sigma-54 factor
MAEQNLSTTQTQKQTQEQRQRLKPLTQTEIRLLRLSQQEFEQDVHNQLDANPALEEYEEYDDGENKDKDDDREYTKEDYDYDDGEDKDKDKDDASTVDDDREYTKEDYDDYSINDYAPDDVPRYYDYAPDDVPRYYDPDSTSEKTAVEGQSFYDLLRGQVSGADLSDKERRVMEYMIGSLDDDGFLRCSLRKLCDELEVNEDLEVSAKEAERVLRVLQTFEPAGIGAQSLQECLVIQLKSLETSSPLKAVAIDILTRGFDDYKNKRFAKLCMRFKISREDLDRIYELVRHLNPRPAGSMLQETDNHAMQIIPDFIVRERDGEFVVALSQGHMPKIKISSSYCDYARSGNQSGEQAAVRRQVNEAKLYLTAVKLRQNTLLETMKAIVKMQPEYFHTGERSSLVSMTQADIARIVGRDPSTISGVVSNKYADTPFGIVHLGGLFTQTFVNQQGDEVSREIVMKKMRRLIDEEDKSNPISDEQLAAELNVARRTVAKYRKIMKIPVARLRR